MASLDSLTEQLYDLDRAELRRLAWEALLISDGPDSPYKEEEGGSVKVLRIPQGIGMAFSIRTREGNYPYKGDKK